MTTKEEIIDWILEHGDESKRKLAERFNTTEYQALEAKKEAKVASVPLFGPKIAVFDLETTGLRPEMGSIICCSVLTYPTMEWRDFCILDYPYTGMYDDGNLAVDIRNHLEDHHILVGWNSKGFDIPFTNTRLAYAGERKIQNHLHIDPMYCYRGWHGLKPTSSSLKSVAEFWKLPTQKMHVEKDIWIKANGGDKEAILILKERCRSDVEITAMVLQKTFEAGLIKSIQRYA